MPAGIFCCPAGCARPSAWGFHIAAACVGTMCHLVAPEAVAGRVPTRHWIKIGVMVAGTVLLVAGLAVIIDAAPD